MAHESEEREYNNCVRRGASIRLYLHREGGAILTAACAPLSLANVKISSSSEAFVEFPSQDMKAIHGVVATNVKNKLIRTDARTT